MQRGSYELTLSPRMLLCANGNIIQVHLVVATTPTSYNTNIETCAAVITTSDKLKRLVKH